MRRLRHVLPSPSKLGSSAQSMISRAATARFNARAEAWAMQDRRPLVMALLLLGAGCTAIVDAGSYEVLAEGGGADRPDSGPERDADTGMPPMEAGPDTGTDARPPRPD